MRFMRCGNASRGRRLRRVNHAPASLSAWLAPQNSGAPITGIVRARACRENADLRRKMPRKRALLGRNRAEMAWRDVHVRGAPDLFAKMLGSVD
jgi:hypothetical protein